MLITDAMLGKGMPDGDFEFSGLHCRKHGQHVQVVETGRRAGSAIGMNDAVRMMGEYVRLHAVRAGSGIGLRQPGFLSPGRKS